ncbi:A-kinase anchor protein 13-like isoform X2 [Paramacrobiotus metropolitanus]|uniref:A-kinase anchor protein 13-like isoform X2 n=1 Tax=Paramacrobiotus metropolitanus TaxID=2943436 RepID=UPI0024462283|nr:A-kinase anchor protein 13-like isoform X2 [Paramacrobiotus metropolitanus]
MEECSPWDSALGHLKSTADPLVPEQLWARRLKSKSEKGAVPGCSIPPVPSCAADHLRSYSSESCPALFTPLAAGNSQLDRAGSETSPTSDSMTSNREWRSCQYLAEDQADLPATVPHPVAVNAIDNFKPSKFLQRQPAISTQFTARFDTFLSTDIPCSPHRRRLNAQDVRIQITGATFDHSSFEHKSSQESICNLDVTSSTHRGDSGNVVHSADMADIPDPHATDSFDVQIAGMVPLTVPVPSRPRSFSAPSFDFIDEASNWNEFGKADVNIIAPDSAAASSTLPLNESFDSTAANATNTQYRASKGSGSKPRCLSTGATSSSEWDVSLDSTDSDRKADSLHLSNSISSLVKSVSTPDISVASGRNLLPATPSTEDQALLTTDGVSFDDHNGSVPTSPPSHVLLQELFARYLKDRCLRDRLGGTSPLPQFTRFSYPSFFCTDTLDGASLPLPSDPSDVRLSLSEALNDPSIVNGKVSERNHLSAKLSNGRASSTETTDDLNQRRMNKGKAPDSKGLGLAGMYGTQGRSLSSSSFNLAHLPHNATPTKGTILQGNISLGGAGNLVKKLKKEKIRRSSRIFGIGGSKSKKTKEEAKRCQQTHSFVSVSFSNTTPCQICGKPLANKSASQCQNCLLTCHDNNCLEQIDACPFATKNTTNSTTVSPPQQSAVGFSLRSMRSGDRSLSSGQSGTPGTPSTPISPSSGLIGNGPQLPSVVIEKMMTEHGYAADNLADATSLGLIDPKNLTAAQPLKRLSVPSSFEASTNTLAGSGVQSQSDSSLSASKPTSCTTDTHADSDSDEISLATNVTSISENVVAHAESKDVLLLPYAKLLDFDPELRIAVPEAEAWSMTQDKEFLATLCEREIKRQDIIYELIQTEKNHCAVLLIIDQIYIRGLRNELQWSDTEIHKFFPSFADILDVHIKFLRQLRHRQQQSRVIEFIGDILIEQFDGERGQRMKKAYGEFCSHHKEAGQIYKSKLHKDRRFAAFDTKCIDKLKCHSSRFDILSCILLVTQRISKYRLLIESILNKTDVESSDKKYVGQAFDCVKQMLTYVDASIGAEERRKRLNEIYRAMDSKSSTIINGEEWKKHQLFDRALIYDGPVQFRKNNGKLVDVQALLLSDCIVFLQENNQKFTFAHVDDKPAVVPLNRVIIRPKAERSGIPEKSLFLISSGIPLNPSGSFIPPPPGPHCRAEMYELICSTVKECEKWRVEIAAACGALRHQEEASGQETGIMTLDGNVIVDDAQIRRMREVINICQAKDKNISRLCEDKCDLLREAADAVGLPRWRLPNLTTSPANGTPSALLGPVISEDNLAIEQLQNVLVSALSELNRLMPPPSTGAVSPLANCDTNTIPPGQPGSLILSPPPMGPAGEELRPSYELALSPTPKRAETFGGYDISNKESMINANRSISMKDNGRARPRPATTNLTQHLQNTSPNSKLSTATISTWTSRDSCATADYSSSSAISSSPSSSPRMSVALPDEAVSGGVTTHSVPLSAYLHSVIQLHWHLNQIVDGVAHQSTAYESLSSKYMETQQKLSAMEVRDRKQNKHAAQLEELRSLQEAFMKEKNQYLTERENENQWLKQKRQELDREMAKLKADKDDMDKQRNALFAQCEKLRESGLDVVLSSNAPFVQIFPNGLDLSSNIPKSPLPIVREEIKPASPGQLTSENRQALLQRPLPPPPPPRTLSASTLPPRPPLSSSHSLNTIKIPMAQLSPSASVEGGPEQKSKLTPTKEAKSTLSANWKGSMESLHKKAESAKEKLRNFVDSSPSVEKAQDRIDSPYVSSNSLSVHPAGRPRPTLRAASEAKLGITNLLHLSEKTSSGSGERELKKKSSEKKRGFL